METGTFRGTVVIFDAPRGWGMVLRDSDGKKIYFHVKNALRNCIPSLDMRLEFEMGPPYKTGMPDQAVNLRYERKVETATTADKVIEFLSAVDGGKQ
jgi:cold shock CspA family protein